MSLTSATQTKADHVKFLRVPFIIADATAKRVCGSSMWCVLALQLVCTTLVGALDVSPTDPNWKASVEAVPSGTTVSFRPGLYHGCNVSVPAGAQTLRDSVRLSFSPSPSTPLSSPPHPFSFSPSQPLALPSSLPPSLLPFSSLILCPFLFPSLSQTQSSLILSFLFPSVRCYPHRVLRYGHRLPVSVQVV